MYLASAALIALSFDVVSSGFMLAASAQGATPLKGGLTGDFIEDGIRWTLFPARIVLALLVIRDLKARVLEFSLAIVELVTLCYFHLGARRFAELAGILAENIKILTTKAGTCEANSLVSPMMVFFGLLAGFVVFFLQVANEQRIFDLPKRLLGFEVEQEVDENEYGSKRRAIVAGGQTALDRVEMVLEFFFELLVVAPMTGLAHATLSILQHIVHLILDAYNFVVGFFSAVWHSILYLFGGAAVEVETTPKASGGRKRDATRGRKGTAKDSGVGASVSREVTSAARGLKSFLWRPTMPRNFAGKAHDAWDHMLDEFDGLNHALPSLTTVRAHLAAAQLGPTLIKHPLKRVAHAASRIPGIGGLISRPLHKHLDHMYKYQTIKIGELVLDVELLRVAEQSVAGRGDGRISENDAKDIYQTLRPTHLSHYRHVEKVTMAFVRASYHWTERGDTWLRNAIRKWAAEKSQWTRKTGIHHCD